MLANYYLIFKALHIVAVICWMAGLFYLPRLFAYHVGATPGSELDLTLQTMERRLYKIIMMPSLIAVFIFGFILMLILGIDNIGVWLHVKLLLVSILAVGHFLMGYYITIFQRNQNTHSARFFKIFNEVPPLIMIIVVFLAILKPF